MKPRLIAASLVAGALLALPLAPLEPAGLGLLYKARDAQARLGFGIPETDARIRLLVLDQEAYAKVGKPFGLWAPELAEVLTGLAKAETAVVGLDVALNPWQGEGEAALALSMRQLPVILADQTGLPDGGLPLLGGDPTVRQSSPALVVAAMAVADDQLSPSALPPPTSFVGRVAEVLLGHPPTATGLINYGGALPQDDFSDVLARLRGGNPLFEFKGVACLIVADGWTWRNLLDTPAGRLPTGDIQGAALNTLLLDKPVRPLPLGMALTIAAVVAAAGLRRRWLALLTVLYGVAALEAFTFTGWWLPLVGPLVGLVGGSALRAWSRRPTRVIGKNERLALLCTHLGGFTAGSPERTIALLEDYVEDMEGIATRHQGTLTRLAGDELLLLFPNADAALQAGLAMRAHVDGMPEFTHLGMALHSGQVVTGDVSGQRTVLGQEVTHALQAARASGPRVLVTPAARDELTTPDLPWHPHDGYFTLALPPTAPSPAPTSDPTPAKISDPTPAPAAAPATPTLAAAAAPFSANPSLAAAPPVPHLATPEPERTPFGSVRTHIAGPARDAALESVPATVHEPSTVSEPATVPEPALEPAAAPEPAAALEPAAPAAAQPAASPPPLPPAPSEASAEPSTETTVLADTEAAENSGAPDTRIRVHREPESAPTVLAPAAKLTPAARPHPEPAHAPPDPVTTQPSEPATPAPAEPARATPAVAAASPPPEPRPLAGRFQRHPSERGFFLTLPAAARPTPKMQEPDAAWLERGDRAPD